VEIEQFPTNFRVYAIALYINVSISHIKPLVTVCATVFTVTKREVFFHHLGVNQEPNCTMAILLKQSWYLCSNG